MRRSIVLLQYSGDSTQIIKKGFMQHKYPLLQTILTVIVWHEYISDTTLTHGMGALRHRTDYVTPSSNVHFMCSIYGDLITQWQVCISASYRQITCCSIWSEKLIWCVSLSEIPTWTNTRAALNIKSQLHFLEADYVCIYLGRCHVLIGEIGNA